MAITPSQWSHVLTIPESYTPSAATSGQTLVITESVIAKLSVGDQTTFWSNVQNGGGDVRICTDSAGTNQLPVEIVSLDNVAETCVIWTRKATYAGTGELYVFIGKAGETQPTVTDPFGRNAVWQDEIAVYHFKNDASDSTANGYDGNVVGASLQSGGGYEFTGTDRIELPSAVDGASNLASFVFVWENNGSTADGHLYDTSLGSGDGYDINYRNGRIRFDVSFNNPDPDRVAGPAPGPSDSNEHIAIAYRANDSVNLYLDGVNYQGDSFLDSIPINGTMAAPFIGNQANSADPFGAGRILKSFRVRTHKSVEYYNTEYANQSDPASFYGTPTIATTGGATSVTADAAYTINAPTFTSSASASLPQPVANTAFTLNAPTFSGSATATTPGFSASVAYSANAPTFTADAAVTLPQPTADVAYAIAAPTFSVDSTATLPQPTASAAFSLPAPSFAASATVTQTGFNASVNFTLPAPTFSADANATLPQPIADGNFTITAPTFSVVAIAGGIAIIVDNETNINMPALSTNINAPVLSNNVRI